MTITTPITISFGDGVGPEIMYAVLNIIRHANVPISTHTIEIGARAYHHGFRYGIPAYCMDKIMENKILLMAPHASAPSNDFETLDIPAYLKCDHIYESQFDGVPFGISNMTNMKAKAFIGKEYAVFMPTHEHYPELEGQDVANPSGMLLAAILMLQHIGLEEKALMIERAWIQTLEDGYRTSDIVKTPYKMTSTTTEFIQHTIEKLCPIPRKSILNL